MRQSFFGAVFAVQILLAGAVQAQIGAAELDSVFTEAYTAGQFNGSVLFARNGELVYSKAFGIANQQLGVPVTTATPFNLASVAKQFTSMAIMILAESGQLDYDDPMVKFLPTLPYEDISVRHLLHHQGGLPDYQRLFEQDGWDKSKICTNADLVALLAETIANPQFEPGTQFEYSNTGYLMLASIVQKVSGMSFPAFLKKNIFDPLGMDNSFAYNLTMPDRPAGTAIGYRLVDGEAMYNDLIYLDGVMGDGNVYSSAEDLFIWDRALYSEKLVTNATIRQAFTPGQLSDGSSTSYGFGWGISNGGNTISHGGGWVGFRTLIRRDLSSQSVIIVLTNNTMRAPGVLEKVIGPFLVKGIE